MAELIWDGKYDSNGKKVAPLRVALPFQTVETINESVQERQKALDFTAKPETDNWRNRLIWGDKKYVLPSLLPEFAGKVDLIYIDPPFNVGADFSFRASVGETEFEKVPSLIETKAYRDTWGGGLDSFVHWFFETAVFLNELLADDGSLCVHLDYHTSHYAKAVLDEVFGSDNFRNEIILPGRAVKNLQRQFETVKRLQVRHDVLLWYSKSESASFSPLWVEKHHVAHPEGHWHHFWSTADRPTMRYELFGITPTKGQWTWKEDRALKAVAAYDRYMTEGGGRTLVEYWRDTGCKLSFIRRDPDDGKPLYWRAPAEIRMGDTVWSGLPIYASTTGYQTEKSETFISEVINLASDSEDDLILDCFCGSGTTAVVAEKTGRRWIACDLGRFAVHTTRKRLLELSDVRPFFVQNLGKYERQVWQKVEFGENTEAMMRAYRGFILDLYHAEPVTGYARLHGRKAGRMVHVGSVDSPVSHGDVQQMAIEFRKALGTGKDAPKVAGIDVLGWDHALDMNETMRQIAQEANLDVRFYRIPREVLESKAVEQGDIRFFELAALSVDQKVEGRKLTVKLTDFMVPPDDVPEDIIKAVGLWSEWIDYWSIDFDYKDDTFHNQWQSYRTRSKPRLELEHSHVYASKGKFIVVVKVIDILGNDTTKKIEVSID